MSSVYVCRLQAKWRSTQNVRGACHRRTELALFYCLDRQHGLFSMLSVQRNVCSDCEKVESKAMNAKKSTQETQLSLADAVANAKIEVTFVLLRSLRCVFCIK